MSADDAVRSLWWLRAEMIATSALVAMPIMTIFYRQTLGMSMADIGWSQAACNMTILLLTVPLGWVADRLSRKWCNVIGDAICAMSLLYYATATSFTQVVLAEVVFGIGAAFSNGVDGALMREYCERLGQSLHKISANTTTIGLVWSLVAVMIGGWVGSFSPRLAIALSATVFMFGTFAAWQLRDGTKLNAPVSSDTFTGRLCHAGKDMWRVVTTSVWHDKKLRLRIAAHVFGREVTHPLVWILTPLLLVAGVALALVGLGWAANTVCTIGGSLLASRYATLPFSNKFALGSLVALTAAATIAFGHGWITVACYGVFGLVNGWFRPVLMAEVAINAPAKDVTTVTSLAGALTQLLYFCIVPTIVGAGESNVQQSLLATLVIFTVPLLVITWRLWREHARQ